MLGRGDVMIMPEEGQFVYHYIVGDVKVLL